MFSIDGAPTVIPVLVGHAERSVKDSQVRSIEVDCYAGYTGEERPVRFRLGDQLLEVDEILDRWLAPDHRYFKVRAGIDVCILRKDITSGAWELTVFQRGGRAG